METTPPPGRDVTLTTFVAANEIRIGVLGCGVGFAPLAKRGCLIDGLVCYISVVTSADPRALAESRSGP